MQNNTFDPRFLKSKKVKIHAEKVALINNHKTRKIKLKDTTLSSKELIAKASHLSASIDVANKIFNRLKLPYMDGVKIAFYSPEKVILQTDKQILKSKVKELEPQLIKIMKRQKIFSQLKRIEVNISFKKTEKKIVQKLNKNALKHIKNLKEQFDNK